MLILLGMVYVFTFNVINNTDEWNQLMITISLGLLSFITIFYTFVLKKELENKRKNILINEWKKNISEFIIALSSLQKEADKDAPNYSQMMGFSKTISEKIENITLFDEETDLKRHLSILVWMFLVAIFILFFDSITDFYLIIEGGSRIYARAIGYLVFMGSFLKIAQLISIWTKITSH